jgi:hypothetical protein
MVPAAGGADELLSVAAVLPDAVVAVVAVVVSTVASSASSEPQPDRPSRTTTVTATESRWRRRWFRMVRS